MQEVTNETTNEGVLSVKDVKFVGITSASSGVALRGANEKRLNCL